MGVVFAEKSRRKAGQLKLLDLPLPTGVFVTSSKGRASKVEIEAAKRMVGDRDRLAVKETRCAPHRVCRREASKKAR